MSLTIVFDIETAPIDDVADYIEQPEAPINYKDPEKIAAYVEAARQNALDMAAVDVDLCKVVCIGYQIGYAEPIGDNHAGDFGGPKVIATEGGLAVSEEEAIEIFWLITAATAGLKILTGFNCLGFDLPVLLRRSLYLGIKAPDIQIDRFRHPRVTDLMQVLSYDGKLRLRGLSFYCKRFGIDVPDPLPSGAAVGQAIAEGRGADVAAHCVADVTKTAKLAEKMGLFFPGA